MFTNDDAGFLQRLGARADAALASADSSSDRLRSSIAGLRDALDHSGVDAASRAGVNDLLDAIGWACSSGDRERARMLAAGLPRAVRDLHLPGLRAMQVVDAAQQIRSLVVLAA
jgi:hypothetical protein